MHCSTHLGHKGELWSGVRASVSSAIALFGSSVRPSLRQLLARNGPAGPVLRCLLMGVKRKSRAWRQTDAIDPIRTLARSVSEAR